VAHEIRCGNRTAHASGLPEYHRTVEGVRRCYDGTAAPCNWMVETRDCDGGPCIVDCYILTGAMCWDNPRGWECESGHEHVREEVRMAEGWEYCENDDDVKRVAAGGRVPVGMDGGSYTNWGVPA